MKLCAFRKERPLISGRVPRCGRPVRRSTRPMTSRRLAERVHVAAAAAEPAVDAVGQRGRVGDGDVKRAARAQNAADFADRGVEFDEVFQAVIADDGVEHAGRERHAGGVGGNVKSAAAAGHHFQVEANDQQIRTRALETARPRAPRSGHARRGAGY